MKLVVRVLADSSVWIDHLHAQNHGLSRLIESDSLVMHPIVLGEIRCGGIRQRERVLALLGAVPVVLEAEHQMAALMVEHHRLWGRGLCYADVQLLASSVIAGVRLWTRDIALDRAAQSLGVRWSEVA